MKIRRVIQKDIEHDKDGIQVSGKLNAVIAINVDEQPPPEKKEPRNKERAERGRNAPR